MSLPYHILYKHRSTEGCPKGFERIDLNDDLKGLLHHIETDSIIINSIFKAVGRPDKTFKDWLKNNKTLEFLQETHALYARDEHNRLKLRVLANGGEISTVPENSKNDINYYVKRLFINIPDKGVPKRYHKFTGWLCPRLLVHKLGGWANQRYEVKLHAFLTNHYTDEEYTTLKSEKDDLQRRFDALMENMDAMRNDIHIESKRMRKELKDKTETIRKDFDIKTEEIKAIVRSGCKTTTSAAKEIKRIASTDKHITSNYTTGLLLVLNNQSDMPFNDKPTRRLKFRAIEQGSIKGGTYKHEMATAWKTIPNSHPKDAFKIVANEMHRAGLSIPISNHSTSYWHGNTKEIRIYESKLSAVESFIDNILPGLLNGELTELNDKANVIQESAKQILNDI